MAHDKVAHKLLANSMDFLLSPVDESLINITLLQQLSSGPNFHSFPCNTEYMQ